MEPKAETVSVQEFSNDSIKVKVYPRLGCKVELEVELASNVIKKDYEEAIKRVGKVAVVDGFRKGKAPLPLIEKNYPSQIDAEWQKCIAHTALKEALKITGIPILGGDSKANYNLKQYSITEGAKLFLFFEREPEVPQVNPNEIELQPIPRHEIDDREIDKTMRQIQFFFTNWHKIEDRPVQENDFVILDVASIEEEIPQPIFTGVRFEVTDTSMAKWMKELVLGKNKGESIEGLSVPDQEASAEEKELKPKKVRLHIKEIQTTQLPELNDDFAKKLGVSSIEEARKNVSDILNKKINQWVREKQREQVCNILLEKYRFELPDSLIDRELRFRMQHLLTDAEYLNHWEQMTREAKQEALAAIREQCRKAVQLFYLSGKILSDNHIPTNPEELANMNESPLNMLLEEKQMPHGNTDLQQLEALSRLTLEKAEDYLIQHARIAAQ